jgi:Hydrazine synthase alpha subunit middle domain
MYSELVAAQPRRSPAVILDKLAPLDLNPDFVAENVGILNIRSVYDIAGVENGRRTDNTPATIASLANPGQTPADQRAARFLRIEKAVSQPDDDVREIDNSAFGASNFMREILGYVPIEPDGSVRVKVPANVSFIFSILDKDGRRIGNQYGIGQQHLTWLQLRPGEVVNCQGCPAGLPRCSDHRRALC